MRAGVEGFSPHTYTCMCRSHETQCARTRRVCTNICMMAHQHAVCDAAPTEPLRRVNLRSEPFGPLQFRLISKIYEFGSRQITHPLISPVGLSQPRRRGGGLEDAAVSQSHAAAAAASLAQGRCFFSAPQQPFSPPKSPPDTEQRGKYLSASSRLGEKWRKT